MPEAGAPLLILIAGGGMKTRPTSPLGLPRGEGTASEILICTDGVEAAHPVEPVLGMGGAGDPTAPVGDPPTGTAGGNEAKRPCPLARTVAPVPSGESPDGTGGSPVLPANHFWNTPLASISAD